MPTGKVAIEFLERLTKLETKVQMLMSFHKWEMGLLAAILLLAIGNWLKGI